MKSLHSEHASRKINGQAVWQALANANAPVSRAELARELGLSKQTLSEIMGPLERAEWTKTAGRKQGALGRAAQSYEINPDAGFVLGVVFEGEQFIMGLADMRGYIRVKKHGRLNPRAMTDGGALGEHLISLVQGLISDSGVDSHAIRYMVIGCPGVVDPVSLRVHHSPNLTALQNLDLKRVLSERFDWPIFLDNDLNLHAYGEYRYGCSQNTSSSVFIGLGSGIGMGIMLGGQVWRGARGGAGEIGYLPMGREPLNTEEKKHGALEYSLNQLRLKYLETLGADPVESSGTEPHARGQAFDDYIDAMARDCATAVTSIMTLLDPEIVVVGGPLGQDPQLHARLSIWLQAYAADAIVVRKSALGQDAGLLGAIAMALQATQAQLFSSALGV